MWKAVVTETAAVAIFTVVLAHAQQVVIPAPHSTQSNPPSSTTGRAQPQAPVGHRQPRTSDIPNGQSRLRELGPSELKLDQDLKICRDC
jgi:hypothetical protein